MNGFWKTNKAGIITMIVCLILIFVLLPFVKDAKAEETTFKTTVIPYGVNSGSWWTAVAFYNHSTEFEEIVSVTVQRSNGTVAKVHEIKIPIRGHGFLLSEDILENLNDHSGRFSIVVEHYEMVYIVPIMGIKDTDYNTINGYSFVPTINMDTLGKD
jgi:hypothetical protein